MNVMISGVTIKRDDNGLHCLNDLWRAKGAINKEKPNLWASNAKTKELVSIENLKAGNPAFKQSAGRYGGTYASKVLVYDYAMWISPEFKSHVIDVFDASVIKDVESSLGDAVSSIKMKMIDVNKAINNATTHFADIKECGKSWGKAGADIRKAKRAAIDELEAIRNEVQLKLELFK